MYKDKERPKLLKANTGGRSDSDPLSLCSKQLCFAPWKLKFLFEMVHLACIYSKVVPTYTTSMFSCRVENEH